MHYTADRYLKEIVLGMRTELVGWPAGIPFGNVSSLHGGNAVVECLLHDLQSGRLYFQRVSGQQARKIAKECITPGKSLPRPPRRGRSDVKVHRLRTVKMALYPLTGPKTPAMVDSDSETSKVGSDRDAAADEVSEWESDEQATESDGIEEWNEGGGQ